MELMVDLHVNSERQGPGSEEETLKALSMMHIPEGKKLKIADIGCGSGSQTFSLARHSRGDIIAVDLFPSFLKKLDEKAADLGFTDKITSLEASMDKLPFEKESFDIIWSEGAIYNIGFETGIRQWRNFLKPGGYLAVSEITWISRNRPVEIEDFWTSEYPEIGMASEKIRILEDNGYTLSGYFYLKPESWIENYYKPLEKGFAAYLERNKHSQEAKKIMEMHREEIALYQKFKDYYSYGFYIARRD